MDRYTMKDIVRLVREEDVAFIRLQFTDIFGTLKNIAVTPNQLLKALSGKVMFDGSAIEGFARIEESDMFLVPDLDTFAIFPWRPSQGKVARLICNVFHTDGKPFEGDSRYVLMQAIEEAAKDGYTFKVGSECEFFLFETDENGSVIYDVHVVRDGAPVDAEAFLTAYRELLSLRVSDRLPGGWQPAGAPILTVAYTRSASSRVVALYPFDALHYALAIDGEALFRVEKDWGGGAVEKLLDVR